MSLPSLWTSIVQDDFTRRPGRKGRVSAGVPTSDVLRILDLSGGAPLKVHVLSVVSAFVRNIFPFHTARIQDLKILDFSIDRLEFLNFPAPMLENLEVGELDALLPSNFLPVIEVIPVFANHAPRLKVLVLRRLSFIPRNTFPSLTHLHLEDTDLRLASTSSALFEFISRCSCLEEFVLTDAERWGNIPHHDMPSLTHLVHLRKLGFQRVSEEGVHYFLSRVHRSHPIAISLVDCTFARSDGHFLRDMSDIHLVGDPTRMHLRYTPFLTGIILASSSSAIYAQGDLDSVLTLSSVPLGDVQELWISMDTLVPGWGENIMARRSEIENVFDAFRALTTVVLSLRSTQLQAAITVELLMRGIMNGDAARCPLLHTVHVDVHDHAFPAAVFAAVALRAHKQRPIARLIVEYIPGNVHVKTVRWDDLRPSVGTLEIRETSVRPRMQLPDVCNTESSRMYWPQL